MCSRPQLQLEGCLARAAWLQDRSSVFFMRPPACFVGFPDDHITVPRTRSFQGLLAPMQRRDKQNVVTALDLVCLLTLELPVRIINQDQDSRTAARRSEMLLSRRRGRGVYVSTCRCGAGDVGAGNAGDQLDVYVHVVLEDEELLSRVLHDVLAEVLYEEGDGHRLAVMVVGGDGELVKALV